MKLRIATAAMLLVSAQSATAATGDIPFNGAVTGTCTINVQNGGALGVRNDLRVLNSANFGGSPGRADVVATLNTLQISVDQPTAFDSQPVDDTAPNDFLATYRVTGATNIARTANPASLSAGTNRVRVHLRVRKGPGETFAAGNYAATVVLRCE